MTKRQPTASGESNLASEDTKTLKPRSLEEAKVWEVLEEARQRVKPIVRKEKEAEILTSDLMNLRLKAF